LSIFLSSHLFEHAPLESGECVTSLPGALFEDLGITELAIAAIEHGRVLALCKQGLLCFDDIRHILNALVVKESFVVVLIKYYQQGFIYTP
jgi:hypothetical protein